MCLSYRWQRATQFVVAHDLASLIGPSAIGPRQNRCAMLAIEHFRHPGRMPSPRCGLEDFARLKAARAATARMH
ncbi:hypothetical protein AYJ54_24595 [Bradyrhizobium centrolobii]|uniref:Uncharacterized protein n=1 Tax=Bradyrhizobium centrolobii TaxID=1505087 RepID=A0A176YEG4_9BRAD|nr:hypothetical protein AYJ54_24595 [Bradyrhizobium centrolobii]